MLLQAAEGDACSTSGFVRGNTSGNESLGLHREMKRELFFHSRFRGPPRDDRASAG
jgi:hypothetical protein